MFGTMLANLGLNLLTGAVERQQTKKQVNKAISATNQQTAWQQQAIKTGALSQEAGMQQARFQLRMHAANAYGQLANSTTVGRSQQRILSASRWQAGQEAAGMSYNQQNAALSSNIAATNAETTRSYQVQNLRSQVPSYADVVLGAVIKTAVPMAQNAIANAAQTPTYQANPAAVAPIAPTQSAQPTQPTTTSMINGKASVAKTSNWWQTK